MVRQLRPGCSIPTDCGETRTLALVLRVTTRAAGSGCPNCHGRATVSLSCALQPCMQQPARDRCDFPLRSFRTAATPYNYGIVCTHAGLGACSHGISERIIWGVWCPAGVPMIDRITDNSSIYQIRQPNAHITHSSPWSMGLSIYENADPCSPRLIDPPYARPHRSKQPLKKMAQPAK